ARPRPPRAALVWAGGHQPPEGARQADSARQPLRAAKRRQDAEVQLRLQQRASSQAPKSRRTAIPSAAMISTVSTRPRCSTNANTAATAASADASRSSAPGSKEYQRT